MSSGMKRSFNKSILDKSFSSGRVIVFSVTLPARAKCHSCFKLGQSAIFPVLNRVLGCTAEKKDPLATTIIYQNSEKNSPWVKWKAAIGTKLSNKVPAKSAASLQHQVQRTSVELLINC